MSHVEGGVHAASPRRESIDIVVSGSSARMLSREIHMYLRGRAMPTVIAPFGFREAFRHRGRYPEAQGSGTRPVDRATRIALVQGHVDTVLFRDVIERHALEAAIYHELCRRGADVAYVKTTEGFEVDFLAHPAHGDRN